MLAQMVLGASSNDGQVCRARRGFAANHIQPRARARESEVPVVGLLSMTTRVMLPSIVSKFCLALSSRSQASPNFLLPATPTTNDHRDDSYPPKWYDYTPIARFRVPLANWTQTAAGRKRWEKSDLEAWNPATQRRRKRKRAVANIPPCAGHWTILPAAGRRPECRQPGCL